MHPVFNPTMPDFSDNIFIGQPDPITGAMHSEVYEAFRKSLINGAHADKALRPFVNFYLAHSRPSLQICDVGNFFALDDDQAKAVAEGTNPLKFINATNALKEALDANGNPTVHGYAAPGANTATGTPGVNWSDPQTVWDWLVSTFQANLNRGVDGSKEGGGTL